jgi:hypothetical protein
MKRKPGRASSVSRTNRPTAAYVGVFSGATLAALLAAVPIHVTVALSPEPRTVVAGQADTAQRPECQATLTR